MGLVLLSLLAALPSRAEDKGAYGSLFSEEVLTVTRERDGILPGTLRSAIIQANGIRQQNSFALVKIVFDPNVERVQITKGPLPEIDGSLTTLDCSRAQNRVLLEYVIPEDNAGEDPGSEPAVLTLSSNGNVVRNCHITGAVGPGILIRGNRNIIEQNTIGYNAEVPESTLPPSGVFGEPKTNGRSGIILGKGANENILQNNDIIGNTHYGVLLEEGVGTGNKIFNNFFAKNSGQAIKSQTGSQSAVTPIIKKITQVGDTFYIEGTSSPRAEIQIYMLGDKKDEIQFLIAEGKDQPKNNSATFTVATKSKGFVLGKTQLVALAHGNNLNTSEFSDPIIVGIPEPETPSAPVQENSGENHETVGGAEEKVEGVGEATGEGTELPSEERTGTAEKSTAQASPPSGSTQPSTPQGSKTGKMLGDSEPETVINLNP